MTRSAIPEERYRAGLNAIDAMIESAIAAEDVLIFSYPSSATGQPKRRKFSPWLLERDGEVVKGWDHDADGVRRYALARIRESVQVDLSEEWVRPL